MEYINIAILFLFRGNKYPIPFGLLTTSVQELPEKIRVPPGLCGNPCSYQRYSHGQRFIQSGTRVEQLLLHIERRWLGCFRHLTRMSLGQHLGKVFQAYPTRIRTWERSRTHWRDQLSQLTWKHLGVSPEELEDMAERGRPWFLCSGC